MSTGPEFHQSAGDLGLEAQGDSFIGLDVDDQLIGLQFFDGVSLKEPEGRLAELDGDLRHPLGQSFSGPEVKWHPGPAPVVNHETEGNIGLGPGIRGHPWLCPIAGTGFPSTVPSPYCPRTALDRTSSGSIGWMRMKDLGLLIADGIGIEGNGTLHGDQGQQLEEVIGHHVAQRAGGLVIAGPIFHAHGLGGGDLDTVNVAPVPDRLEDAVREAEGHDVLDRRLAEVVVDAVDLVLTEDPADFGVEVPRGVEVTAEGFLKDDAPPCPCSSRSQTGCVELLTISQKGVWGDGEIEKGVFLRPCSRLVSAMNAFNFW